MGLIQMLLISDNEVGPPTTSRFTPAVGTRITPGNSVGYLLVRRKRVANANYSLCVVYICDATS